MLLIIVFAYHQCLMILFIIPLLGCAYTFSIVWPAESTGAKLWSFAPHGCDRTKCLNHLILGGSRV